MIFEPTNFCFVEQCTKISDGACAHLQKADLYIIYLQRQSAVVNIKSGDGELVSEGEVCMCTAKVSIATSANACAIAIGLSGAVAQDIAKRINAISGGYLTLAAGADGKYGAAVANFLSAQYFDDGKPIIKDKAATSQSAYALVCAFANEGPHSAPQGKSAGTADEKEGKSAQLVLQAVTAIREKFGELSGIEELSDNLGVSKNHLVRVFSAAMGTPPGKYLTNMRIDAAKQLLLQRDYTLEIIAAMCGFSCSNYFCKVFKKHEGITPVEYRHTQANTSDIDDDVVFSEQSLYV